MSDLPNFLKSGAEARLIPVVADSKKEERTSSIFMAALQSVPCFHQAMFNEIGMRLGTSARIRCFTEVTFRKTPDGLEGKRPDGLIIVNTGRRSWSALVEAKVDKHELGDEQVKTYLTLARLNGIDAVITLSNQMVAHPTHHPLKLKQRDRKGVDLYHWSWTMVKTIALLELNEEEFKNPEQRFILREVARYLEHETSGVSGFTQMNPEWKQVVEEIRAGLQLKPTDLDVENTVASWHQEQRDLSLRMSQLLGQKVESKLSPAYKSDPMKRLKDDCRDLAKTDRLSCVLKIDGAADMEVVADLKSRAISCGMTFKAPSDRKSAKARINWLVRQLRKTEDGGVVIFAHWPGGRVTRATLHELREADNGLDSLIEDNAGKTTHRFDVCMTKDLGGQFVGRRKFIEEIEKLVPDFYETVGQHVTPFQQPAPKVTERKTASEEAEIQSESN